MGMCKPSGGKFDFYGPYRHSLPGKFLPNTRIDYYDEATGELIQQRWYGPDGLVIWDRDWNHNDFYYEHYFPHDHSWDWSKKIPRQKPIPVNSSYC